ncbi:MAG: DUF2341 domain-containing protein [Candidatus Heimdallarchaeota archaeon]
MKNMGGKPLELKIGRLLFLTFIFFLLVTTPAEKQSPVDDPSQIDDVSPVNSSPETERITYTPEASHKGSKALYSLGSYDYQKRIQINVTNNMNEALSQGYSVSFSLNTWYLTNQGDLQADGDDLRIAYNDSGSWVELNRVNTTAFNTYKTLIWFKTENPIAANSYDANYWIYYGNPSVSDPPHNPAHVFVFFDDFDDGDSAGWIAKSGSWWVEEYPTGSGNYVLRGSNNAYFYKETGSYGNVTLSARIRWEGGDRRRGVVIRFDPSVLSSYRLNMNNNENQTELWRKYANENLLNSTTAFPSGMNYAAGDWYCYEIAAQTVNTDDVWVRGRIYDDNMTLRMELSDLDDSVYALDAAGQLALYGEGWFDDVIVRNFVNPEPTVELKSPLATHLMLVTYDSTDPDFQVAYTYSKDITIDHTQVVADLTDFPTLLRLHDTDLKTDVQSDGDDIAFFDSADNQLDHELVLFDQSYSPSEALLIAWVKCDLSNTTDTVITMKYGNPDIESQANPVGVWSNGYEAVLHLQEMGSGQDDEFTDSSGHRHHGTGGGVEGDGDAFQTPSRVGGLFGYAQNFHDWAGDLIRLDHINDQDWINITVQVWMNPHDSGDDFIFAKAWESGGADMVWKLGKDNDVKSGLRTNAERKAVGGGTDWTFYTWTHYALTWSAGGSNNLRIYRNGTLDLTQTISGTDLYDYSIQPTIGNVPQADRGFDGLLQEVRLSYVARSEAWLNTEFNNQIDPDSFYTVGIEQTNTDEVFSNAPFYNHIVQDLGYVVDYHGRENKDTSTTPFYLEGYDGVLISITASDAWTISLRETPIPILSWESRTFDELYLGSNHGTLQDDEIYIVNTTHNITTSLQSGINRIYSVPATMSYLIDYDPLPSGSEIDLLARAVNNSSQGQLIALEKGNKTYIPLYTAPERRVFWPAPNGSALTTEGWALFDRAFHWALHLEGIIAPPIIQDKNYKALPAEDGLLLFWFNATDIFPGIDPTSGFVNITATDPVGPRIYSMSFNGTHFIVEVKLPYWVGGINNGDDEGIKTQNLFNYTVTVSDLSGLSDSNSVFNQPVLDKVAPSLGDSGVTYSGGTATIWSTASDSVNGSGIEDSPAGVTVTYFIVNPPYGTPQPMTWNNTHWVHNVSLASNEWLYYYINATDRKGNFVDNQDNPGYFNPQDTVPPVINAYSHEYYGNGTVRFWADVTDNYNVSRVDFKYNSTVNPVPQTEVMWNNGTFWVWDKFFDWNTTLSPYAINYTIALARDESGNKNTTLANVWDVQHSLITEDLQFPVITTVGFKAVPDVNGHMRFWADISDSYSGLDTSRISINITLSSGASNIYSLIYNGTFYINDTNIAYWETKPTTRMAVTYNVTAFDNAGLSASLLGGGPTTYVPDKAPPELDTGIQDFHNGTVTIWAKTNDGIGSGFPEANDSVLLTYRKNGIGPFYKQMVWNGTSDFYTYTLANLLAGDILAYQVKVEDIEYNSRISPSYMYGVGDETPPTIHASGYYFIKDVDGHICFWADVTEDIGSIKEVRVEGSPSQFSGIMTYNGTFYEYDLLVNSGTSFSYNITASNMAGLTNQTSPRTGTVLDQVAPPRQNFVTVAQWDNQDGTVTFRVQVTDGQRGSGINPDTVVFIYRVGGGAQQTRKMVSVGGSNYDYTVGGLFVGDVINYQVRAQDNAGNQGMGFWRMAGVSDHTAPVIDQIGYDYLPDSDGHIRFWCYADDPFGTIGKLMINITGDQQEEGAMLWVGAYYYYDTELPYENTFNFEITVRDTAGNKDTQFESGHTVQDIVPPRVMGAGGEEFQNGTAVLWANVTDGNLGSGFPEERNTVSIVFQKNYEVSQTIPMTWNGTYYIHEFTGLRVGDVIDFSIQAKDKANNSNVGIGIAYKFAVPDKTPPQINSFGYNLLPDEEGHVRFWVSAEDPFGSIENVSLSISISESSTLSKSASATSSLGTISQIERVMRFNGTHYIHDENLGYQTMFSYTITVADGANLQVEGGASEQIVGDGAPPRVLDAGIIDPGDGDLTIWAEVAEKGTGVDSLEFIYSVDEGTTWRQAPMQSINTTHYSAKVQVEPGSPILWTIATKDLGGNANTEAWDVWVKTPYITATKGIPLIYLFGIIAAAAVTTGIAIKKFRKVVGLDKERVMAIANQMSDDEVIARLDDHTYGVILSFFDQREGPVPSIITPSLLEDHMQFLVDLSDRSFSAGGFVEETTEEKVTIFDLRLGEARMMCVSYAFAIDNPEARGGKENMTINLLVDPVYSELTNIFSPEILPSVRQIRSLIETKVPRENISAQMDGLRSLVTRIIAAYQELYGEEAIVGEGGQVIVDVEGA